MKKIILSLIVGACVCFALQPAFATNYSTTATIYRISNYNGFPEGAGDLVVYMSGSTITTCQNGYWIGRNEPSYNTMLALTLFAKTNYDGQILVNVDDAAMWGGGVPGICHLYSMSLSD